MNLATSDTAIYHFTISTICIGNRSVRETIQSHLNIHILLESDDCAIIYPDFSPLPIG